MPPIGDAAFGQTDPDRIKHSVYVALSDEMEQRIAVGEVSRAEVVENTFGFLFDAWPHNNVLKFFCALPRGGYDTSVELERATSLRKPEELDKVDGNSLYFPDPTDRSIFRTVQSLALEVDLLDVFAAFLEAGGNPNLEDSSDFAGVSHNIKYDREKFFDNPNILKTLLDYGFNLYQKLPSKKTPDGSTSIESFYDIAAAYSNNLHILMMEHEKPGVQVIGTWAEKHCDLTHCDKKSVIACANMDRLDEVMHPHLWTHDPERGLAIMEQLPKWIQCELKPQWQAIREMVALHAQPEEPNWQVSASATEGTERMQANVARGK